MKLSCFVILSVFVFFSLFQANAQTPQYFNFNNSSASTNSFPLNSTSSNKVQWIYAPGALTSLGNGSGSPAYSGNITRVYFRTSTTATPTYTDFTISLGQVMGTATNFGTTSGTYTFLTGLTQSFYQASYVLTGIGSSNNWRYVDLQTPFLYDPSLALIFEMKVSAGTGLSVYQSTISGQMQRVYGPYASATGTNNTSLVDFGVDLAPATPCSGTPVPGLTTMTPSGTVCPAQLVTFGVQNFASLGSGITFQWQSGSSAGGPWSNIGGATNATYQSTFSSNTWIRCMTTCTNSGLSNATTHVDVVM
jgi:hypothetical protein